MSKVPETYLYEIIKVIRPIKLDHGVEIFGPKSLYLTKEDVKDCLNFSYINRRFSDHEPVRVTTANLDRLHNPTFISENDWDELKNKNDNFEKLPEEPVSTEVEEETVISDTKEDVIEDIINEEPEDDTVSENNDSDTIEEEVNPEEADPESEDVIEDDETESEIDDADIENESDVDSDSDNVTENFSDENEDVAEEEVDGDNETGVSKESEEQSNQTNTAKYVYNKKHRKGKH